MKNLFKNKAGFVIGDVVIIAGILIFCAVLPLPAVKIQKAIRSEVKAVLDKICAAESNYKLENNVYTNATPDQIQSFLGVDITNPRYCDATCYEVTGADTDHFLARCAVNNASTATDAAQVLRYFPGTIFTMDQTAKKAERIK